MVSVLLNTERQGIFSHPVLRPFHSLQDNNVTGFLLTNTASFVEYLYIHIMIKY